MSLVRERTPTTKSAMSNWLNRLRQVKGFPSDDDGRGLEHFLSLQQQQQPNGDCHLHHPIWRRAATPAAAASPPEADMSDRMAIMLSDLFSDRGSNRILNSKAPRKQPSPKICFLPRTATVASNENNNNNDSNNPVTVEGRNVKVVRRDRLEEDKARKKPEDCDLAGFSRTEVTIIDSSCPLWKFDKYLFRKKNVWKARDRRAATGGYSVVARKKREGDAAAGGDGIVSKKGKTFGSRRKTLKPRMMMSGWWKKSKTLGSSSRKQVNRQHWMLDERGR